jgi:hypothetical protein
MKANLFLILFIFSVKIFGQDAEKFEVLISGGNVPEEFNTLSSLKVKKDIKTISKDQKRSDKKSAKRFILESNFQIDQMLASGAILFNEPLSNYVSKVADELLKNDEELRSNLRFYVIKSTNVNAFATDRGTIFITVGLLAQIENEAQLAYIISHEIVHYKNKHARTGFVENDRIEQGRGEYRRVKWNKSLNKSKYSKELELEADLEGLKIYLDSDYSINEVNSVFDVLQYAHIPIENIPFDTEYFNDKNIELTQSLFLDEIERIEVIEEDDEYHSHPNITKRRAVMAFELETEPNEGKKEFILDKKEFYNVKKLAQFEQSFLYCKERMYGQAIYNSYVLLNTYPDNEFLEMNIGYCLYALSKYKNEGKKYDVLSDYEEVQGHSQQVYYIFDRMDNKTMSTIAVKYLWDLKSKGIENSFLNAISEDAIRELLTESGARKVDYRKSKPKDKKSTTLELGGDSLKTSKYDKIKKESLKLGTDLRYAFVDHFKNKEFKEFINKYEKEYVDDVKDEKVDDYRDKLKVERKKEKLGRALGIEKVVMVSPNYKRFDLRKKNTERHKAAESRKNDFIELNRECADKRDIDLSIISNSFFETTEQYNDMSLLNDWMDERFDHKNVEIFPYCKMYTDNLVTKHDTKYFGWTGMYSLRARKDKWGVIAVTTLLYGVGAIWGVFYAFTPEEHTFYYTYLVDITNYDFLMSKEDYVKMKDHNDLMKSYIYDSYHQIKTPQKAKK